MSVGIHGRTAFSRTKLLARNGDRRPALVPLPCRDSHRVVGEEDMGEKSVATSARDRGSLFPNPGDQWGWRALLRRETKRALSDDGVFGRSSPLPPTHPNLSG